MYATDFEFNGRYLSDYGFIICDIGEDTDINTVPAGGTVSIKTVSYGNGRRFAAVNAMYESCIEAEFTICKDPCMYENAAINDDELRDIMRWLNRRAYYKMRFLKEPQNDDGGCYYNAAFNIDKICFGEDVIGLSVHMTTDSPFGYGEKITVTGKQITNNDNTVSTIVSIVDQSDDIGYIYPDMTLTIFYEDIGEQGLSIVNDIFPDEAFEINKIDGADILAKKITVDGTTLAIKGSDISCEFAVYDSNNDQIGEVTDIQLFSIFTLQMMLYNRTDKLREGNYRFLLTDSFVLQRKNENDTWETVYEDIRHSYDSNAHRGFVGGFIYYVSQSQIQNGAYITMDITYEDVVVGNSFNYNFVKIGNTQDNKLNAIRCNCRCAIELSYNPIVKLSP